ncbi:MAG: DUF111 family protein, partial [Candidatus Sumerlaeota bacterium]|nr:DUF111 family protein [Candidatus Sumerlaeota bacterium]
LADVSRYCLPRRMETIETRYGPVAIKVGEWPGHVRKAKPEFENCRRLAIEKGVTVKEIMLHANERIARMLAGGE